MEVKKPFIPSKYKVTIKDSTPPTFPRKFFVLTMVGSSRAGKTTCIVNMIEHLAPSYNHVVVFTPSIDDPVWMALRKFDNVLVSQLISNHVLYDLFERQKFIYRQDKNENHMLIVIDDYGILARQTGSDISKPLKEPEIVSSGIKQMLDLFYSRGRHNGISLLVSYHDTLQLTPLQRVNNTHVILYRLNDKQYEKIAPEYRCHFSEREFVDMADEYTKQPYHFLYIDLKASKNEDVFKQGKPKI